MMSLNGLFGAAPGRTLAVLLTILPGSLWAEACVIAWPDVSIPVPPDVTSFISAECYEFRGSSEEDVSSCIRGEKLGYRAVVQMLEDEIDGEVAAERYRACRNGLASEGGRFHRRRAECMGNSLGYIWRFEFTRRTSRSPLDHPDFASNTSSLEGTTYSRGDLRGPTLNTISSASRIAEEASGDGTFSLLKLVN